MEQKKHLTARFGNLDVRFTELHIHAVDLACLAHLTGPGQYQSKADTPIYLPITPIVCMQSQSTPYVLNEAVVMKMLPQGYLHPTDQILCYRVLDEDAVKASIYYRVVDQALHLPSDETLIELLKAAYDPHRLKEAALLKQVLCKPYHDDITITDLVTLLNGARKKSTLAKLKSDLGYTTPFFQLTAQTLPKS